MTAQSTSLLLVGIVWTILSTVATADSQSMEIKRNFTPACWWIFCHHRACVQSDCSEPNNMINPTGTYPHCSCSYRSCRQSDCSDPNNMYAPTGTYPHCSCTYRSCVQSDCAANMINPTGTYPHCSCSWRPCVQSDCADPTNMVDPTGVYHSCSCSWRACKLSDCPRPGMVRVRGHYTACHCDTVSESLSLSALVTVSLGVTTATR